jgi:hypothetical protein
MLAHLRNEADIKLLDEITAEQAIKLVKFALKGNLDALNTVIGDCEAGWQVYLTEVIDAAIENTKDVR